MRTPRALVLPVLVGALLLCLPEQAEAQYYGGGYHGGYGYGPPPRPMFGYRHRIHGYVGGQLTGIATLGQTLKYSNYGGYLGHGGGGGGLFGGVRLGPFFSLELNWNITWHQAAEDYWGTYWSAFHLQTVELDGKIHIPTRGLVEPYFQVGIGFAFLGASWEDRWSGVGADYIFASGVDFNVGGGLDVWLSPFLTVGGRVLYKGMRFGESAIQATRYGANFASAINVDVNLAIHF